MVHKFQKKWVFTWNLDCIEELPTTEELDSFLSSLNPSPKELEHFLNSYVEQGVFQLERGENTGRLHYQGRFVLKGPRIGKKKLLSYFSEKWDIINITTDHEETYDSSLYCTKSETQVAGPWYVGLTSYVQKNTPMKLELYLWQQQVLKMLSPETLRIYADRKVIWIESREGGLGKSSFIQYLSLNEKTTGIVAKKLPFDRPDRIRCAVTKIAKKTDVDVFMFDFTRTLSEESSMANFYQVIEEIKNSYIIDTMFGNYHETHLKKPVVMIFTNEHFNAHKKYLSEDRWVPFVIGTDPSLNKGLVYMYGENANSQMKFEQYWEIHTQTIRNKQQNKEIDEQTSNN